MIALVVAASLSAFALSSRPNTRIVIPAGPDPRSGGICVSTLVVLAQQSAPESPLDRAEDAIEKGDYATARTLLTQSLQKQPQDNRALYDLGFVELHDGHAAEAEKDFRAALKIQADAPVLSWKN